MSVIEVCEELDPERERMFDELTALCKVWRDRGIHPAVVAARVTYIGVLIGESVGIPLESALKNVRNTYDPPPPVRPSSKA